MVSNASRETHNFKIKNRKLYEELDEKNIIINDLQEQLQDLKQMFIKMEEQSKIRVICNRIHLKLNLRQILMKPIAFIPIPISVKANYRNIILGYIR